MISEEPADLQATIEQTDSGEQQYVLRALCDHLSGIREELSGIRTLLEAGHAASEAMRGQAQAYLEAQQARTQVYLDQVQIEPEPDFYPFVELPAGTEPRGLPDGNRLVRFDYEGIFLEVLEHLGKMPLPPYIKEELQEYGFIKKHSGKKTNRISKSQPLHFVDDNGFHIYVGKNNYQNDQLTFKFATGNDWWFHAKQMTGSHVIVKSENKELPDSTYEYAAALAAYYSSGRDNEKVEIDYLQKKNVKKPNGSAPGFVVYYTNYSLVATPSLAHVTLVSDK